MSKCYPPERRARAVKMVLDRLDEYRSVYAVCQAIGGRGCRIVTAVDAAGSDRHPAGPGPTTTVQQRIKDLEREVRDLKEANDSQGCLNFLLRELWPRARRTQ